MLKRSTHTTDNGSTASPAASPANPAKARLLRELNERLAEHHKGLPVWIRAPKGTLEHYTNFSRSKLYELAGDRKIRSVSIRERSQTKGTRLFNLRSIFDYIEKCESAANAAIEGGESK